MDEHRIRIEILEKLYEYRGNPDNGFVETKDLLEPLDILLLVFARNIARLRDLGLVETRGKKEGFVNASRITSAGVFEIEARRRSRI